MSAKAAFQRYRNVLVTAAAERGMQAGESETTAAVVGRSIVDAKLSPEDYHAGYDAGYADRDAAWAVALPKVLKEHEIYFGFAESCSCECGAEFTEPDQWDQHIVAVCRERLADEWEVNANK